VSAPKVTIYGHEVELFSPEELGGTATDVIVLVRTQNITEGGRVEDMVSMKGTEHTSGLVQLATTEVAYLQSKSAWLHAIEDEDE